MPIAVEEVERDRDAEWVAFVGVRADRFAYHSIAFRSFLEALLPDGSARYLVARRDGEVVGALPLFVDRGEFGAVVTSLPFHCSNGAVLSDDPEADAALVAAYAQVVAEERAVASSLVTMPVGTSDERLRSLVAHDFAEPRHGQWTVLPADPDALWAELHGKTRNAVRKAEKSEVKVRAGIGESDWDRLEDLHVSNMARLGAPPKTRRTLDLLRTSFEALGRCDLWIAEHDDLVVAAVLCVEADGSVEYVVPGFDEDRRDLQALSLAVWTAMADATSRGARVFNWGGTPFGQDGVRRFKSRWNGSEGPYSVLTSVHDRALLSRTRAELTAAYPQSFVVPFHALEA